MVTTLRGLGLSAAHWESAVGWLWEEAAAVGSGAGAGHEWEVLGSPSAPALLLPPLPRDCRASRVTVGWLARREKR